MFPSALCDITHPGRGSRSTHVPRKIQPPAEDKRWKIVAATMKKLGNTPRALIETLHTLQQVFGYLDKPGLTFCRVRAPGSAESSLWRGARSRLSQSA